MYPVHIAGTMKLSKYLEITKTSDSAFGDLVNRERSTVTRWRLGKTRPDLEVMMKIAVVTDGAVTASDFAKPETVEVAE